MDSRIVDVFIGLAFLFMIVSVFVSTWQEMMAGWLQTRSKQLAQALRLLLFGKVDAEKLDKYENEFWQELVKHPEISSLSKTDGLPSYLPARSVAAAVLDLASRAEVIIDRLAKPGAATWSPEAAPVIRTKLSPPSLHALLLTLSTDAGGDSALVQKRLEAKFDDLMSRVSGWYKRRTQLFLLLYGFILAALFNLDAIAYGQRLWADPVARNAVVEAASKSVKDGAAVDPKEIEKRVKDLSLSSLPVGYDSHHLPWQKMVDDGAVCSGTAFMLAVVGWMITAFAASLGAPFWFDLVGKLVSLRNSGLVPKASQDPASGTTAVNTNTATPPASSTTDSALTEQDLKTRNELIDLHGRLNASDPSYRPVQPEETWR